MPLIRIFNNQGQLVQEFSGFPFVINYEVKGISIKVDNWINLNFDEIHFTNDYNGKCYQVKLAEVQQKPEEVKK